MPDVTTNLLARLDSLADQFDTLERQLVDPQINTDHRKVHAISVKRAAMEDLVVRYRRYRKLTADMAEHRQVMASGDAELAALAREELPNLETQAASLLEAIANELVTADDAAVGAVILEVRAGAGGAEAALWAGEIFEMYQRFAALRGWKFEVLDFAGGEMGGLRHATAAVEGPGVWQGLGYEGGVHCVKRVPATEAQGRIHTSTCTVAVLPEPEEVQIHIPDSDVKMDITTSQGPGGQNVNKVATAVKLVHIPTGIEVRMQESKSQQQNRARAWQVLRARVYDHFQRQKNAERAAERAKMIGSGDRSERIRTYRFKESIAVDHRLDNGTFPLAKLLAGDLGDVVAALLAKDRADRLAALPGA
jgi:peptide chain release factor 1